MTTLVVSAVAFVRGGMVLTVRKRGTQRFMLVGGKLEPGEDPAAAAVREAIEEVGVVVDALEPLGEFVAEAANEPDHRVHSSVFAAALPAGVEPAPLAEIEELRWLPLADTPDGLPGDLAPLLEHHVLPVLRARHFGGSVRA